METGKVNSWLLYPRRGMVVTSADMHVQQQNSASHKEITCGMDCAVSKLYRTALWSVRHLFR